MTLTGLTKAMEDAATVDLRGQVSFPLLRKVLGKRSPKRVRGPLRLLASWAKAGGHRATSTATASTSTARPSH